MKKFVFALLILLGSLQLHAKSVKNDTIPASQKEVSEWITEKTTNSKGNEVTHYYAIWNGYLLSTTKTTIEKVTLCKKYNTKCTLLVIGPTINGVLKPKRIVIE